MASQQFDITSLFQPSSGATTTKRKDSGVSDAIDQLKNFKGFDTTSSKSTPQPQPVTLTFTPSSGSTCISLYPRTKTFTYSAPLDSSSCLATCEKAQTWRISAVPPSPGSDSENRRFTFERVDSKGEMREAFRRCSVAVSGPWAGSGTSRGGTSVDVGRKLSVGHFSSGINGFTLPYATRA